MRAPLLAITFSAYMFFFTARVAMAGDYLVPSGIVRLSNEAFDAAEAVEAALKASPDYRDDESFDLVSMCVQEGATRPMYKLTYRKIGDVCVERPWRLMSWYFDLESPQQCRCEHHNTDGL